MLLLSLCSCAADLQTSIDYDNSVAFSGLHRYAWMPGIPPKSENPLLNNRFLHGRIRNTIDARLQARGYRQDQANPDFLVAYQLTVADKSQVTMMNDAYTYPMGWGYGRRYTLGARNRPRQFVYEYKEGTLIIDIVNAKTKQLMWRGSASGEVKGSKTPEQKQKRLSAAVEEILRQFPP